MRVRHGPSMMLPTADRQPTTSLLIGQFPTQHSTRVIPCCQFCMSDSHSSHDCTFGPDDSRHYQNRQPLQRHGAVRTQVAQICRLFNQPGGGTSATSNSAGMHTYVPGATGHTQCLSVTGASPTVPGQPRPQARRGKRRLAGSRSCSSSHAC